MPSRWSRSDNEANAKTALREHAALISHYACGASLFGKAAKFRRVLKAAGIAPQDAIAIGDEVRDVEAARDAGIAFGAVAWGYATVDALKRAGAASVRADGGCGRGGRRCRMRGLNSRPSV